MRIALTWILTTMIFAALLGKAAAQAENLKIESSLREQLGNASPNHSHVRSGSAPIAFGPPLAQDEHEDTECCDRSNRDGHEDGSRESYLLKS